MLPVQSQYYKAGMCHWRLCAVSIRQHQNDVESLSNEVTILDVIIMFNVNLLISLLSSLSHCFTLCMTSYADNCADECIMFISISTVINRSPYCF